MSVSGSCEICGHGEIEATCDRCGRLVCERHVDEKLGFCVECAAQVGGEPTVPAGEDMPDGVDTYRL
ncbi:MAG: hypothetical protein ABEH56_03185 [Salinirussus sp.]